MTQILAWHGDPELKAHTVARMKKHREQDDFIRGTFLTFDPEAAASYRGCFHGCLVAEDVAARQGVSVRDLARGYADDAYAYVGPPVDTVINWHHATERAFGIPVALGEVLDNLFEEIEDRTARGEWAVAVTEAIPVGADLSGVVDRYDKAEALPGMWDQELMIHVLAEAPIVGVDRG